MSRFSPTRHGYLRRQASLSTIAIHGHKNLQAISHDTPRYRRLPWVWFHGTPRYRRLPWRITPCDVCRRNLRCYNFERHQPRGSALSPTSLGDTALKNIYSATLLVWPFLPVLSMFDEALFLRHQSMIDVSCSIARSRIAGKFAERNFEIFRGKHAYRRKPRGSFNELLAPRLFYKIES